MRGLLLIIGLLCGLLPNVAAAQYAFRDGFYWDGSGARFTRSIVRDAYGCSVYQYSRVADVPVYREAAYKGDDFFAILADASRQRVAADSALELLAARTDAQVRALQAVSGGRALYKGYAGSSHVAADVRGQAYGGNTYYGSRTSTTVAQAVGDQPSTERLLTVLARSANNFTEAGREINTQIGERIGEISQQQAATTRAIVENEGVATKLELIKRVFDGPSKTTVVQQTTELIPQSVPSGDRGYIAVPLLQKYCAKCHTAGADSKGFVALDGSRALSPLESYRAQVAVQTKSGLREQASIKAMPPDKAVPDDDFDGLALELISLVQKSSP